MQRELARAFQLAVATSEPNQANPLFLSLRTIKSAFFKQAYPRSRALGGKNCLRAYMYNGTNTNCLTKQRDGSFKTVNKEN
jgi:hypothetical protein